MSETDLRALPNVGPKIAQMLLRLGVEQPTDLRGRDPEQLFEVLCDLDGRRHDPCLLDTFYAIVDVANGATARPWWYYSRARKARAADGVGPGRRPANGGLAVGIAPPPNAFPS